MQYRILRARNAADDPSPARIRVVEKLLQHRNALVISTSLSLTRPELES